MPLGRCAGHLVGYLIEKITVFLVEFFHRLIPGQHSQGKCLMFRGKVRVVHNLPQQTLCSSAIELFEG